MSIPSPDYKLFKDKNRTILFSAIPLMLAECQEQNKPMPNGHTRKNELTSASTTAETLNVRAESFKYRIRNSELRGF